MAIVTPKSRNGAFSWSSPQFFAAGMATESVYNLTATGTTQGTAALASQGYTSFGTVPANSGTILPSATITGHQYIIDNQGVNTLNVYPSVGSSINGLAVNAPITVPAGSATLLISSAYNSGTDSYDYRSVSLSGSGSVGQSATVTLALLHGVENSFSNPLTVNPGGIWAAKVDDPAIMVPDIAWHQTGATIYVTAYYDTKDQGIKVSGSTLQSIPDEVETTLLFDASPVYTSGLYSYNSGTGRITINETGLYAYSAFGTILQGTPNYARILVVRKNGGSLDSYVQTPKPALAGNGWADTVYGEVYLTAGDYLELRTLQDDSGGVARDASERFLVVRKLVQPATYGGTVTLYVTEDATSGGGGGGGVPVTRQIIAGAGLTGGGDLSADRTLNVVANADNSIIVNTNDIQVGVLASDAQHGVRGGGTQHAVATNSTAGFMSALNFKKVNGWVSVLDFGADPTGVADSLSAFKQAIAYTSTANYSLGVEVPMGTYTLSNTLDIDRAVVIHGAGWKSAAHGALIQGQKGLDVIRVLYVGGAVSGGGTGSTLSNLFVTHQNSTAAWQALTAGYVAGQSAVMPVAGYGGYGETGFTLLCAQSGTSGAVEPTWSSGSYTLAVDRGGLVRAANVTTVTISNGAAHGYSNGNSIYVNTSATGFTSGVKTITVTSPSAFTYPDVAANATSDYTAIVGKIITDGTTAWVKNYVAGIKVLGRNTIHDVFVSGVGGDGISIFASTGDGNNANSWNVSNALITNCRGWGFLTQGADSNAGVGTNISCLLNDYGGILENSFLGNMYIGCSVENNALSRSPPYGYYLPSAQANNASAFWGCYSEEGQTNRINGKGFFFGGQSTGTAKVYGTGTIITPDHMTSLFFTNDTNNDGTGDSSTIKIGRISSQVTMEMAWSQNTGGLSTILQMLYGVVNGSSADSTGWVAWGTPTATNYAFSLGNSAEGAGAFWIPNDLWRGTGLTGRVRNVVVGYGAPSSGTYATGDTAMDTRPDLTGVLQWQCISGGTPGTWAPVFHMKTVVESGGNNVQYTTSHVASTGTGGSTFSLPTIPAQAVDGKELTIKDESGTAGTSPITITPAGGNTIDGLSTFSLATNYGSVTLIVRNGNWWIKSLTPGQVVIQRNSNLTLTSAQSGYDYHNTGASSQIVYTLPASPKIGDYFGFYVDDTDGIKVLANTGQTIRVLGDISASAGYTESFTQGSYIQVEYIKSNYWVAKSAMGTWTTV